MIIPGRISSVMGDRNVESDDNTELLFIDANNFYGMGNESAFAEWRF